MRILNGNMRLGWIIVGAALFAMNLPAPAATATKVPCRSDVFTCGLYCGGIAAHISVGHEILPASADSDYNDYGVFIAEGRQDATFYYRMTGWSGEGVCLSSAGSSDGGAGAPLPSPCTAAQLIDEFESLSSDFQDGMVATEELPLRASDILIPCLPT